MSQTASYINPLPTCIGEGTECSNVLSGNYIYYMNK